VEGTVREVKRRVRVVASSYRAIDRSVTKWIVVTMVEWSLVRNLKLGLLVGYDMSSGGFSYSSADDPLVLCTLLVVNCNFSWLSRLLL